MTWKTAMQGSFLNTMKTSSKRFPMTSLKCSFQGIARHSLALALALNALPALNAAPTGKSFASPEEAVSALAAAASTDDRNAFRAIFGAAAADLENPDFVQATNEHRAFCSAFYHTNRIVHESDSKCMLEVGQDLWPFPIPIVKRNGQWFFDTEAGKDELLNRRIGRNELATLQSVRAFVEAQREYAARDRDGDEVLEFAQQFRSTPGMKDGMYWPPDLDGEISPLGPLAAQAQELGYGGKARKEDSAPEPFHGYLFRVLTRQGKHAPGGKYDYIINGNMIAGFALVAWPAEYSESGVMTFIVNQQGRVYQRDLGKDTARIVKGLQSYDPDNTWQVAVD
jgi:hypothetical protein